MSVHSSVINSIENNFCILYSSMILCIRHDCQCSWQYSYGAKNIVELDAI